MQLPAGHDLPHTRARTVHWLTTAAALAVVTGAAALVQPSNATAAAEAGAPAGRADAEPPAASPGPDPRAVEYPLECGPVGTVVTERAGTDLDADGVGETVAVVRCDAGSGTPPSGMYLIAADAGPGGTPAVAETLVDPREGMTVDALRAEGDAIAVRLTGYSSADVPRCCPDLRREVRWEWRDGRLVPLAVPGSGAAAQV
ncbi:hypothetical protein RM780_03145 [Streptomyces sp. DSM 44917]|uniref:Secreted protein n=1 Tax=Streptomyces boetiae TaxID=3075541 RepID=A0ABU2L319_9ACTN|nr:hypothetical protein [Streptomyces sp. DSM 44917]MDT0305958.1 hypothetical protein [Streptomyces sp. DSM 44917]